MSDMWQWMDATYGGMGWFTSEQKAKHEGTDGFKNGWWRQVPKKELDESNRVIGRWAYEQS